ncbi:MAG: M67 family metallopeptidase [Deltaproteobacteria bacterium]|jgi:proteasome lid subunit RPN8/RPN11|nr:M67 family metallopeptidase [Deltaproteobacteria bacterium]
MTITLPRPLYEELLEHCRRCWPQEGCGLLAGRTAEADKTVEKIYPLPNLAQSRTRFDIDQKDQLRAVIDMRKRQLTLLGNFHSHPDTPARPSEQDLQLGLDPAASYLILSLAEKEPALKAFRVAWLSGQPTASQEELIVGP